MTGVFALGKMCWSVLDGGGAIHNLHIRRFHRPLLCPPLTAGFSEQTLTGNGMGKTTSTSLSATALLRGLRLAAAIRLTYATGIVRFLIRTGKSAIPNPNALGDMEPTDFIQLCGCASGSGALSRLLRPRPMSRPPTIALDGAADGRSDALRSAEESEPCGSYRRGGSDIPEREGSGVG